MEVSKISRENPHLGRFAPREFALSVTRAFLGEFYCKTDCFSVCQDIEWPMNLDVTQIRLWPQIKVIEIEA